MSGSSETRSWLGASLRSSRVSLRAAAAQVTGLLLAASFVASPSQAVPLTLVCSGTATTQHVPKNAPAADPKKEGIADMSVVVDFDGRTVSGLWTDVDAAGNWIHPALPIRAADANSVRFGSAKNDATGYHLIDGAVDRISGKVDATDTLRYRDSSMTILIWDLRCRPSKPLF
jgi:hypothetical protein